MKDNQIFEIDKVGSILDGNYERKYNREFAGSLEAPLYQNMISNGSECVGFYKSVEEFNGRKGAAFYKLLWYMLVACHYLQENYDSSFKNYIKIKYSEYKGLKSISDEDFHNISLDDWENFKKKKQPWNELYGVGINVFDYIMGDIIELKFLKDSYKLDSANERFLKVTGVIPKDKINHEDVKDFLLSLNLDYTLREVNKGLYTYITDLNKEKYGFCRDKQKCKECNVYDKCEMNFN